MGTVVVEIARCEGWMCLRQWFRLWAVRWGLECRRRGTILVEGFMYSGHGDYWATPIGYGFKIQLWLLLRRSLSSLNIFVAGHAINIRPKDVDTTVILVSCGMRPHKRSK